MLLLRRVVTILRRELENSARACNLQIFTIFVNSAQILRTFQADFCTLNLSVTLLYDPVCHISRLP